MFGSIYFDCTALHTGGSRCWYLSLRHRQHLTSTKRELQQTKLWKIWIRAQCKTYLLRAYWANILGRQKSGQTQTLNSHMLGASWQANFRTSQIGKREKARMNSRTNTTIKWHNGYVWTCGICAAYWRVHGNHSNYFYCCWAWECLQVRASQYRQSEHSAERQEISFHVCINCSKQRELASTL